MAARPDVHREPRAAGHTDAPALRAPRRERPERDQHRPCSLAGRGGHRARELYRAAPRAGTAARAHIARIGRSGRGHRVAHGARARLAPDRRGIRGARDCLDGLHHLRVRPAPARGARAHPRTRERGVPHPRTRLEQLLGAVPLFRGRDRDLVDRGRGWVSAIAVSHPDFYGAMAEWGEAFGGAPIYTPEADREWVQRADPTIVTWRGTRELAPGVTLVQCGGHFDGSAVLHWAAGASGRGTLLVGDTITVVPDVRFVSFMRSYPNLIPLPADEIRRIVNRVRPYRFDRIYGGWWDRVVRSGGIAAVDRSAERYLRWIGQDPRLG